MLKPKKDARIIWEESKLFVFLQNRNQLKKLSHSQNYESNHPTSCQSPSGAVEIIAIAAIGRRIVHRRPMTETTTVRVFFDLLTHSFYDVIE